MRLAPITSLASPLLSFATTDSQKKFNPGFILLAAGTDYDTTANVPNWGFCELMYVAGPALTTFIPGTLVTWDKDFQLVPLPNTGNTGRPCGVVLSNFSGASNQVEYGWILTSGIAPVREASATAGPVFISGAGVATPTPAAGKQILGMSCLIAASGSFTRQGTTLNGSKQIRVPGTSGMFVGQAVSGAGIPGSSTIASIDPGGQAITLNNAATASATVTMTFTNTGYGICQFNRPHVQGQIT